MSELPRSRPASAYQERADSLLALLKSDFSFPRTTRTVIAVAGESGSGKSVTAIDLTTAMMNAGIRTEIIEAVDAPVVNYSGNRFDVQRLDFAATGVLVVEGTFALLMGGNDIGISMQATWQDTASRRKARNRAIDDPSIDTILGIEHDIIAPQALMVDILLDRDLEISKRR